MELIIFQLKVRPRSSSGGRSYGRRVRAFVRPWLGGFFVFITLWTGIRLVSCLLFNYLYIFLFLFDIIGISLFIIVIIAV